MVYIDGKLAGCTLIPQKGIPIHKLIGILPFKEKVIILLDVLKSVKELTDHYIYPIDLDNSPYTSKARYDNKPVGHSHVLVTLVPLKTNIIDLMINLDYKSYANIYSKNDFNFWKVYPAKNYYCDSQYIFTNF